MGIFLLAWENLRGWGVKQLARPGNERLGALAHLLLFYSRIIARSPGGKMTNMRQQRWFAVLLGVAVSGFVAVAAEKPPADYQKAMKDLGAVMAGVDKAVAAEDWDTLTMMGASAREAFVVVEKYWDGKNADAKEIARTGGKQSQDLIAVAGQKSKEGAEFSAGELKAICTSCHTGHREAQPDGSFLIK